MEELTEQIGIRVTPKEKEQLSEEAKKQERSASGQLRWILTKYFENKKEGSGKNR